MSLVTRRWKDWTKDTKGGTIAFDVSGVSKLREAEIAESAGVRIPRFNETFAEEFPDEFKCDGISVTRPVFTLFRVVCSFSVPTDGNEHPEDKQGTNPTLLPPEISWGRGIATLPVESDYAGNALVNMANDPIDPPLYREFSGRYFTITKYMNAPFDQALSDAFTDTVNETEVIFQGDRKSVV